MNKVLLEVKKILDLIYSGNFGANDVAMLYIYVRRIDGVDEITREVGDFMAHSDGRDNGKGHRKIREYICNILEVSAAGGTVLGKKSICKKETVINKITEILKVNISTFNEGKFREQQDLILKYLFEKLDGIDFKFSDVNVNKCYLKNNESKISFCFNIMITSGKIQIGKDALWCNNLID